MNLRHKLILKKILESKENVNVENLSKEFSVSVRTIKKDIHLVNDFMESITGKKINFEDSDCICAELSQSEKILLKQSLMQQNFYFQKLSSQERECLILIHMLETEKFVTAQGLAEFLCVSRGTILADIKKVKLFCVERKVEWISKTSHGMKIKITEERRRKLLSEIIKRYVSICGDEDISTGLTAYKMFFQEEQLEEIKEIVTDIEEKHNLQLSDVSFDGLVLHLALAIKRHQNTSQMTYKIAYQLSGNKSARREYVIAKELIVRLQNRFNVCFSEEEAEFIATFIFSQDQSLWKDKGRDDLTVDIIASRLIYMVSRDTHLPLYLDKRLYTSLVSHLGPAIFRMRTNEPLANPMKQKLISEFPKIFESIKFHMRDLGIYKENEGGDDEIAYLTLHFAVASEKLKGSKHEKPNILIVCSNGFGTARILQERIQNYFNLHIVDVIAVRTLKKYQDLSAIDMIISTVDVDSDIPVMVVSPILEEQDILKVQMTLFSMGFKNVGIPVLSRSDWSYLANELLDIISTYGEKKDELKLYRNIVELIGSKSDYEKHKRKQRDPHALCNILKKEYIRLNVKAGCWQESIRSAGEVLVERGLISTQYVDASIRTAETIGPYIVVTKGVAIPHASNEYGVYQTAISLVRLCTPVCFGNEYNDPVKYVFMLATTDSKSHIPALSALMNFLSDDKFCKLLNRSQTSEEIWSYINLNEGTE